MNNSSIKKIEQTLIDENRKNHEASSCVECKPDMNIKGGVWIKKKDIGRLEKIGQPVYMDDENILLYPLSHNMIVGSTGSGKTSVLYNNCIDFYMRLPRDKRPSFMVFDLKGDMYTKHSAKLEKLGYKVKVFNSRDSFFSATYNPLESIFRDYTEAKEIKKLIDGNKIGREFGGREYRTKAQATEVASARYNKLMDDVDKYIEEIAQIFVTCSDPKNLTWAEGARSCLKAILYTMLYDSELPNTQMTKECFTVNNLCNISFHTDNDYTDIIEWLERARNIRVVSGALGSCYRIRAQVTRDGYISTLNSELNKFSSLSVGALTASSDISFRDIADGNDDYAIFIITDDRRQVTNNIAIMLLNDLINVLTEKADNNPTHSLDKDFIIFADEMCNFPALPEMKKRVSTLRSRKIWLHMAIQSIEQLEELYNEKTASTILENCDLQFVIGCNNYNTKEAFVRALGETVGISKSANIGSDGLANLSVTTVNVPVVRKSDIDALELGEFYLRSRTCQSIKSYMLPYFMRKDSCKDENFEASRYNGFDPEENVYDIVEVLEKERKHQFLFKYN